MTGATGLSPRELEVLERIRDDASNAQIAFALGITEQTVKNHMSAIFAKLQVGTRTAAVLEAIRTGLISLDGSEPRPGVPAALAAIGAFRGQLDAALDELAVAVARLRAPDSGAGSFVSSLDHSASLSRSVDEGSPVAGVSGAAVNPAPSPNQQVPA